MNSIIRSIAVYLIFLSVFSGPGCGQSGTSGFPELKGRLMGQKAPGLKPEPFLPDIFSTGGIYNYHLHSSLYFSSDGRELFFTNQIVSVEPDRNTNIMTMKTTDGTWGQPELASFSGEYSDQSGWFSSDNNIFYFGSVRPKPKESMTTGQLRLWSASRSHDAWEPPRYIGLPGDLSINEGPIYIGDYNNNNGSIDIFLFEFVNGHYTGPIRLGESINSKSDEYPVLFDAASGFLIIYRTDSKKREISGLYISYKDKNGDWSVPKSMGDEIGTGFDASLSPDKKYLFYLRRLDGIYWVDAKIIDYLRTESLNIIDALYSYILSEGHDKFVDKFKEQKRRHQDYCNFNEKVLDSLGMKLFLNGHVDQAAYVLKMNLNLFPHFRSTRRNLIISAADNDTLVFKRLSDSLITYGLSGTDVSESSINRIGYRFLNANHFKKAERLFKLNIDLFPRSYNVYDSYAEVQMVQGNYVSALENYNKSLELNQDNKNAVQMIEKIKQYLAQ